MKTTGFLAGASRFAHLAGLARPGRRAAEEDKNDKQGRRADEDEDDKDGRRASDDDDDDQEPKGKRGRRAEEDDDGDGKQGRRASDDDDDGDEPRGKRGSRAEDDDDDDGEQGRRASEDDDDKDAEDDEEEMKGKGANARARRREQARIAHILGHSAAASNVALAVSLACETRMTRREAVAVLKGQGDRDGDRDDAPRSRHARRDRQDRNARLGSDVDAPSGRQAVSASWDGAFARAGIATKPKG